jgi:hypothetical protein
MSIYQDFSFLLSSDLENVNVKVYIDQWDCLLTDTLSLRAEDVFVAVRLVDGGTGLHQCVRVTKGPVRNGPLLYFGEWLTLPVTYRDLPRTAQLVVMVIGPGFQVIAGSTVRCFDERGALKRGLQHVSIWPTAAVADDDFVPLPLIASDGALEHLKNLESFQLGELQPCPWTDRLVFSQLRSELNELGVQRNSSVEDKRSARSLPSRLVLQFPVFAHPVIWEDVSYHDSIAGGSQAVAPIIPASTAVQGASAPSGGSLGAMAAQVCA